MIIGDSRLLGVTVTTISEARNAVDNGADYVGFGPVFDSSSKAHLASVKGLDGLAAVCDAIDIPVIAIAGITAARVGEVLKIGAYGIAVMTAVSLSQDPEMATKELADTIASTLEPSIAVAR